MEQSPFWETVTKLVDKLLCSYESQDLLLCSLERATASRFIGKGRKLQTFRLNSIKHFKLRWTVNNIILIS
jgi:hypothetical protein